MTHRERFIAAATHQPVDRAVWDLCGSPQTQVDYDVTKLALMELMGFEGPKQGPYGVDERILIALDIDARLIGGMPTPDTSHVREEGGVYYNTYGIGHREVNGHYEICYNPLKGATLDEMMAFEMPDADKVDMSRIVAWAEQARQLHETTDYAVIAEHPVLGVFELGCWMFGFDDYLYRLAAEPEMVHAFSERVIDYQLKMIEKYYGALGRYIDCTTSGDDFGMQNGPFMSKRMFDQMIAPYLKKRIEHTRKFTGALYKHHTCGSVHSLIPSLIDCGVDILNPIQPGVTMMEPERLKADFGDRIAFWGGIDTQHLLPEGSVDEIKAEVKRILGIMGDSGYILASAHTIQPDVPARNLLAVFEGAREYAGGYGAVRPTC